MVEQLKFDEAMKLAVTHLSEFDYHGRSRRSEFWYVMAVLVGVNIVFSFIPVIRWLVWLAVMAVSVFFGIRRLHDIGKSGFAMLILLTIIGVVPLILWLTQDSEKKANAYGSSPKYADEEAASEVKPEDKPAADAESKPEEKPAEVAESKPEEKPEKKLTNSDDINPDDVVAVDPDGKEL